MKLSLFDIFFSRKKSGFAFLSLKQDDVVYENEHDKKMLFGISLEKDIMYINVLGYVAEIDLNIYL